MRPICVVSRQPTSSALVNVSLATVSSLSRTLQAKLADHTLVTLGSYVLTVFGSRGTMLLRTNVFLH